MQRITRTTIIVVATLCAAGCAQSEFVLSRQTQAPWATGKNSRSIRAREAVPPKILPETYFAAARLLEQQGQIGKAIVAYRKAIAVDDNYEKAYPRLGVLLAAIGQHEE